MKWQDVPVVSYLYRRVTSYNTKPLLKGAFDFTSHIRRIGYLAVYHNVQIFCKAMWAATIMIVLSSQSSNIPTYP